VKKDVSNSLRDMFGIGKSRAYLLRNFIGVSRYCKMYKIEYFKFYQIAKLMQKHYVIDRDLKEKVAKDFKLILDSRCFKALRYSWFLPLNGQNTRTNGRTSKNRRGVKKPKGYLKAKSKNR
jgi:small subunit ribosomal protein S13